QGWFNTAEINFRLWGSGRGASPRTGFGVSWERHAPRRRAMQHKRLCDLPSVGFPILCAPMGFVTGPGTGARRPPGRLAPSRSPPSAVPGAFGGTMLMRIATALGLLLLAAGGPARAADYPEPASGEYVIRDFRFANGETLSELRIHYRTLGKPQRDDRGTVR